MRDSLGTRVPSRIALLPVRHIWPSPGRCGHTDSNGVFLLNDIPAGSYFVLALPFSGYAPAYYAEGEYGVSNWRNADTVVESGAVTGINVGVVPISNTGIARLAGRIRNTAGASVAGVGVLATNTQGDVLGYGLTDGTGRYAIDSVAAAMVTLTVDRRDYTPAGAVVTVAPTTFALDNLDLYQFWVHTELVGRMPRAFEAVFNTPSHHRVHHGANVEYLDRNHAGILIVWDRLFGSFEPERARVRYGLTKNIRTWNPLRIAFHEWAAMLRDAARARGWRARLGYLLAAPGWSPDGSSRTAKGLRAAAK